MKAKNNEKTSKNKSLTMAELLAKRGHQAKGFSKGEEVEAKIIEKTPKALVLDIGGKSEGLVAEKAFAEAKDFIKSLKIGDKVIGQVIIPETRDGFTILSLRKASREYVWDNLRDSLDKGEEISVVGRNAGASGMIVDIFGLSGFIPLSQLGKEAIKNPQNLIGKNFKVKIIDLEKQSRRIVLSEKEVSEKESLGKVRDALLKLKPGKIYEGEVVDITDFGCFVKIEVKEGGEIIPVEGLVHVSEMSWQKVARVEDQVKVGDKVAVTPIEIKAGKLSLSIKQAKEDPWTKIDQKFKKDQRIGGIVMKVSDFGVFVQLESGIEGLLHMTKIPPGKKLVQGQEINVYIEDINSKEKKISLGLVLTEKPIGYK